MTVQSVAMLNYVSGEMATSPCETTTALSSGSWNAYSSDVIGRPGNWDFNSTRYVIPEGLVSVFQYPGSSGYRIAVASTYPDPYKLLAALAALCGYGTEDEALSIAQQKTKLRYSGLLMRCGPLADLVLSYLAGEGFTARRIHFVSKDVLGWDAGHIAVEIFYGGSWKMWDVANKCYYTNSSGIHLSGKAIVDLGEANCIKIPIAVGRPSKGVNSSTFNPATYYEQYQSTQALRNVWSAYALQCVGIDCSGQTWWFVPGETPTIKANIESIPSYIVKSETVFISQFY